MEEILLEDIVECRYSGLKGTVTSRTEFVNGCIQFGILQKTKKEIKEINDIVEISIDSQSLKIIKKGPRHIKTKQIKSSGGPSRIVPRMRGF
jgi:hypothetical protein